MVETKKQNIKDLLSQYCDIQVGIKKIEKEISDLQKKVNPSDKVRGSSKYFPYLEKSFFVEGIDKKIQLKLELLQLKQKERYNELLEKQILLTEFLDSLENERIRNIIEFRYINEYSWQKIAFLLGGKSSANAIRMEHERFLEKM